MVNEYNPINERQISLEDFSLYKNVVRYKGRDDGEFLSFPYSSSSQHRDGLERKNQTFQTFHDKVLFLEEVSEELKREKREKVFLSWSGPSRTQLKCLADYVNNQDS